MIEELNICFVPPTNSCCDFGTFLKSQKIPIVWVESDLVTKDKRVTEILGSAKDANETLSKILETTRLSYPSLCDN